MHFTYQDPPFTSDLMQGDVIKRTPEVEAILREVHPHYFQRPDNKFFIVITQDCELVRRDGKTCASRYISIAPVRSLRLVVNRYLERYFQKDFASVPICKQGEQGRVRNFLERLLNNNEGDYFFLRAEHGRDFPEDCCAFLALSIALKANFHYQTLIQARILQLKDSFRAKLGWLVGQMYARVGTVDWAAEEMRRVVDNILKSSSIWVEERKLRALKKLLREWEAQHPEKTLDAEIVAILADKVPRRKESVVQQAVELLCEKGLLENEVKARAANLIRNDSIISNLILD
jgi:hypothetical protein